MKKTITKEEILKALRTEPLQQGLFFAYDADYNVPRGCAVCAVGAVLRHMSFETWARKLKIDPNNLGGIATQGCGSDIDSRRLVEEKNYWGALSCAFEAASPRSARTVAIRFVQEHFPRTISLTLSQKDVRRGA